ncbi:PEP-CTERM sorting domain-containing protein [Microcoleus sp. herbarium8]|uniref:PEP-CTERM sorting domain-containing protein n=1 Tax=Microcoleus sp. herbarium8 TaxID=3055436 RepID=UPI002FD1D5AA
MKIITAIASALFLASNVYASTVQVNWTIESSRHLYNITSNLLLAGSNADGDGALLELGYYSSASSSNPFSGNWMVLSSGSIGDSGINLNGKFSLTSTLTDSNPLLPLAGTPLAIRFYDGITLSSSSYFNAVSSPDSSWAWVAPTDPAAIINLVIDKGPPTVFERTGFYDFKTGIAIPEPTSSLLSLLFLSFGMLRRRRE